MIRHGSTVIIKVDGRKMERVIRHAKDDNDRSMIAPNSPIGMAIMGRMAGDKLRAVTPAGDVGIEVIKG